MDLHKPNPRIAAVKIAYDSASEEWGRLLRFDPPLRWLAEVRARLLGPEFLSTEAEFEVWRYHWLAIISERLEDLIPGYIVPQDPTDPPVI